MVVSFRIYSKIHHQTQYGGYNGLKYCGGGKSMMRKALLTGSSMGKALLTGSSVDITTP